ncbi:hypothetical protein FRC04_001905 [Tulasnella sp. 424]|nr:hypothetical protein FRC04_001905 [Tulasnella sp. 424]
MTKPTLLQTLFNQPSRSYIDLNSSTQEFYTLQPQKQQYRRSYDGASPANNLPTAVPPPPPKEGHERMKKTMKTEDKAESTSRKGLAKPAGSNIRPPPRSNLAAASAVEQRPISTASTSSSTQDFYEASERHSWAATSRSTTPRASLVDPLADTSTSSSPLHPTTRPPPSAMPSRRLRKQRKSRTEDEIIALQRELGEMGIMDKQDLRRDSMREAVAEEAEEEDQFFTPPTSPPGSPTPTITLKQYFPSLDKAAREAERHEAEEQNGYSSPSKTPRALRRRPAIAKDGTTPIRSASPSDDGSSSDDSFSNWRSSSSYAPSLSTAPTSVSGFSGSSPPKSSSPGKSSHRPTAHTSTTSSRGSPSKSSSHGKSIDSTSADWAKGVKWLGASDEKPARPSRRSWTHSRRSSVDLSTSASSASSIFDHPVVIDRSERRRSFDSATASNDRPKHWDLDISSSNNNNNNDSPSRHKRSNSMGSLGSSGGVVGTRRRHARARTSAAADAEMQKRMSAVLEVDDNGEVIGTSVGPASQHAYGAPKPPSVHGRSRSSPGHSGSRPPSVFSRSSGTSSYRTVELPSIPATTDGQVTYPNGFTSLTLPRAAVTPDGPDLFSGHVDLARSGLAQVTMGTISIIKGAAKVSTPPTTLGRSTSRLRRLSRSFSTSSSKNKEAETPARLQTGVEHALAFTTSTTTPSKYGPSQMIVKIFVAGISTLDRLAVRSKVRSKADEGYGFVPGRAFVGKVLETGWEVNDVRSGDWVMGLTELSTSTSSSKNSGTLAEYVVVDRTRVSRAPKPGLMLWPGATSGLTMEQIVALPMVAVFAHRAVKTFPHAVVTMRRTVPSMSPPTSPRKSKGKGKEREQPPPPGLGKLKVLVLGAHTDVGDLVVQEFMMRDDLHVTVQVPPGTDTLVWEGLDTVEVVQGEVENVLANLPNGVFVMVVDCVGGENVWKASRRVLDPRCGQFTTVVGDDPNAIPTRQAYTKSGLRSLRHAFIKSGGKTLGYEWVCPAVDIDTEGDDIRTNLVEITRMVEQGTLIPPTPRKVVTFERGMDAFKDGEDGLCAVKVAG